MPDKLDRLNQEQRKRSLAISTRDLRRVLHNRKGLKELRQITDAEWLRAVRLDEREAESATQSP